jgi:hypothetical protein
MENWGVKARFTFTDPEWGGPNPPSFVLLCVAVFVLFLFVVFCA